MIVMVHRLGYNEMVETLLGLGKTAVQKEEYPVTYDVQCEDIRVSSKGVEERYHNAYLSQVQYYLNRVIVKLLGITKDINIEEFQVAPNRHGGKGYKIIKQLLMEETVYVKENGVEYKNPVRKVQKAD